MNAHSWLYVIKQELALVGVSVTVKELGQRTCREATAAQDWAVAQQRTTSPLPRPAWLEGR